MRYVWEWVVAVVAVLLLPVIAVVAVVACACASKETRARWDREANRDLDGKEAADE